MNPYIVIAELEIACRHVGCDFRHADAGELCRDPDGSRRPVMWTHATRAMTYRARHKAAPRRCRRRKRWSAEARNPSAAQETAPVSGRSALSTRRLTLRPLQWSLSQRLARTSLR